MPQVSIEVKAAVADAIAKLQGVEKALGGVEGGSKKASGAGNALKGTWTELNSAFAMGERAVRMLGQAYSALVTPVVEVSREILDFSRVAQISAEQASLFVVIADDLQISTQTMKTGFRTLVDAGIQPNIANMKILIEKYQAIEDPVKRSQFAMETFGMRAGPELQKFLEMTPAAIDAVGAAALKTGQIMSGASLKAMEDYRLQIDDIKDAWEGYLATVVPVFAKWMTSELQVMKIAQERDIVYRGNFILYHQQLNLIRDEVNAQNELADAIESRAPGSINLMEHLGEAVGNLPTKKEITVSVITGQAESDLTALYDQLMKTNLQNATQDEFDWIKSYADANHIAFTHDFLVGKGKKLYDDFMALLNSPDTFHRTMILDIVPGKGGEQKIPIDTGCFIDGTPVDTPGGQKAIEHIAVGSRVMVFVPETGKRVVSRVVKLTQVVRDDLVSLHTSRGEIVGISPNHRFLAESGEFIEVGRLAPGTFLMTKSGPATVLRIIPFPGKHEVHNFEVAHPVHTYLVAGHVVHNAKAEGQTGLDMTVPPGYPSDAYTIGVTSGEHVNVTPAGGRSGSGPGSGGAVINFNGAMVFQETLSMDAFVSMWRERLRSV